MLRPKGYFSYYVDKMFQFTCTLNYALEFIYVLDCLYNCQCIRKELPNVGS